MNGGLLYRNSVTGSGWHGVKSNLLSIFLHRLESGLFGQFPCLVTRIEQREGSYHSIHP